MLYNPFALQFGLTQDDCSALHGVSTESIKQLKNVVICEIIPETWLV